jgi:transketolase
MFVKKNQNIINRKKISDKRCYFYRQKILEISQKVEALHIGGSFSSTEILDWILNEKISEKKKFILSKGHIGIMLYTILFFQKRLTKNQLDNYCKKNGILGVHPEITMPGVEASTGSLGHGLGLAAGISLSKKFKEIYVLISDGELMEGSVWEYVLTISSLKLNNIILIVDNNDLQSATRASDTHKTLYPIESKFKSFHWDCYTCKGHDVIDIEKKLSLKKHNKPLAIVAKTIKGFPISFMQNVPKWHYRSPDQKELQTALNELKNFYEK